MPLADLRKDYALAGLAEKDLARDPFRQFEKWFQEAEASKLANPKANFTFEYGRPMKPHGWQPMTNAEMVRMMDKFRMEHRTQP